MQNPSTDEIVQRLQEWRHTRPQATFDEIDKEVSRQFARLQAHLIDPPACRWIVADLLLLDFSRRCQEASRAPDPARPGSMPRVRLITAIPSAQWPAVARELGRVTRPGGWVELAECGVPQAGGPGLTGLWQSWIDFCATRGVDFTLGHTLGDMQTAAGLINVQRRAIAFPMGAWGGRLGVASGSDCLATGKKALRAGVIASGVRTEAQYDRLFALAQSEFQNERGPHGYLPFFLADGQKR